MLGHWAFIIYLRWSFGEYEYSYKNKQTKKNTKITGLRRCYPSYFNWDTAVRLGSNGRTWCAWKVCYLINHILFFFNHICDCYNIFVFCVVVIIIIVCSIYLTFDFVMRKKYIIIIERLVWSGFHNSFFFVYIHRVYSSKIISSSFKTTYMNSLCIQSLIMSSCSYVYTSYHEPVPDYASPWPWGKAPTRTLPRLFLAHGPFD